MSQGCATCGAPVQPGVLTCPYCGQVVSAQAAAEAVPCPQCRTLNAKSTQKCTRCQSWLVVQCVFCQQVGPWNQPACASCGEAYAGAAERKAQRDAEAQRAQLMGAVGQVAGVAGSFLGAALGGSFLSGGGGGGGYQHEHAAALQRERFEREQLERQQVERARFDRERAEREAYASGRHHHDGGGSPFGDDRDAFESAARDRDDRSNWYGESREERGGLGSLLSGVAEQVTERAERRRHRGDADEAVSDVEQGASGFGSFLSDAVSGAADRAERRRHRGDADEAVENAGEEASGLGSFFSSNARDAAERATDGAEERDEDERDEDDEEEER